MKRIKACAHRCRVRAACQPRSRRDVALGAPLIRVIRKRASANDRDERAFFCNNSSAVPPRGVIYLPLICNKLQIRRLGSSTSAPRHMPTLPQSNTATRSSNYLLMSWFSWLRKRGEGAVCVCVCVCVCWMVGWLGGQQGSERGPFDVEDNYLCS